MLLLALTGGAAGWAYADLAAGPRISDAAPAPVRAADPSLPWTPPEKVRDDSELPPVPEQLPVHDAEVGRPREGGVVVPVPDGWGRTDSVGGLESRWTAPGAPPGSYSVRVQVVDLRRSLAQVVAERAAALPLDPRVSDLEILDRSGDTLRATYVLDGFRKLQIVRWVSLDGVGVDVEIAATGRLIDQPGLDALVARMATDVRRQATGATAG